MPRFSELLLYLQGFAMGSKLNTFESFTFESSEFELLVVPIGLASKEESTLRAN
jgi:hypothetical protein